MRLNHRGLGTGLLWTRIMPALLLLIAVGTGILVLGSHSPSTSARSIPSLFPPSATHALSDAASLRNMRNRRWPSNRTRDRLIPRCASWRGEMVMACS